MRPIVLVLVVLAVVTLLVIGWWRGDVAPMSSIDRSDDLPATSAIDALSTAPATEPPRTVRTAVEAAAPADVGAPPKTAQTILVLVLDHRGRPAAGVRVAHRRAVVVGLGHGKQRVVRTDDDGVAHFAHLQSYGTPDDDVSEVWIQEPGVPEEPVELDCEYPPSEPIRLQLPPTGRIVVRHPDGDGVTGFGGGTLELNEPGRETHGRSSFPAPLVDGRAEYAWVGLGCTFSVVRRVMAARQGPFQVRGPVRPDETVEFVLPEWRLLALCARLLDAHGAPLPSLVVELQVGAGSGTTPLHGMTGADGVVLVPMGAESAGEALRSVRIESRAPNAGLTATVDAAGRDLAGIVDLGDIVLRLPPLWAAGRAVDQTGAPLTIDRAQVECVPARDGASAPSFHPVSNGRFELRGGADVARVRVVGAHAFGGSTARLHEPVEIAKGARDAELVLVRMATARVIVAGGGDRAAMMDVALHPAGGGEAIGPFPIGIAAAGATAWSFTVDPGRYRLTVGLLGEEKPRATIDDVDLRPGPNDDPRLTGIVIPDTRVLRIELVGDDGRLRDDLLEGFVFVRAGDVWRGRVFMGAGLDLLAPTEPIDVIVAAPGFRPVRRERVVGDFSTTLGPLPSVPVRLEVTGGEAPKGTRLVLRAERRSDAERFELADLDALGPTPWIPPLRLEPGAAGELPVDGPGEYRIRIELAGARPASARPTDFEPWTFVLPPAGLAAPLVVRVPAAALRP